MAARWLVMFCGTRYSEAHDVRVIPTGAPAHSSRRAAEGSWQCLKVSDVSATQPARPLFEFRFRFSNFYSTFEVSNGRRNRTSAIPIHLLAPQFLRLIPGVALLP